MESLRDQISNPSIPEDVRRHMGSIVSSLEESVRSSTSFSRLAGGEEVQTDRLKEGLEAMVNVVQKMSSVLADHQQLVAQFERLASGVGGGSNANFSDLIRRMDVPPSSRPGGPTHPGEQDTTELNPEEVRRQAGGEVGTGEDQTQKRVDQLLDRMEQRMEQQLANIAIAYTQKLESIINGANEATLNAIRQSTVNVSDNFRNLASYSNPRNQGDNQDSNQGSSQAGQDSPTGGSAESGDAGARGGEGDNSGQAGTRGGGGDGGSEERGSQGGNDRHIPVWIMNPYINIRGGTGSSGRRGQQQQDPVDEATDQANEQDDRSAPGTRGGARTGSGRQRITDPNAYYERLLERRHMREMHPANYIPNALEGALDMFTPGGAPVGRHFVGMAQFATHMIGRAAYQRLRGGGSGGLTDSTAGAGEEAAAGAGEAAEGAGAAEAGAAATAGEAAAGAGAAEAGIGAAGAGIGAAGAAAGGAALGGPAGLLGGLLLYGGSKIVGAVGHQYFDNLSWQQKQLGRFGAGEEQLNPLSMVAGQTPTDKLFRAETETRLRNPSLSGEQIDKLTEASAKLGNTASQTANMLEPAADAMTRFGYQGQFAMRVMTAGSLIDKNDPTGARALAGYTGVREAAAQRGLPSDIADRSVEQGMQMMQGVAGVGASSQLAQTDVTALSNLPQNLQKEVVGPDGSNPYNQVQKAMGDSPMLTSILGGDPGAMTDPSLYDQDTGELNAKGRQVHTKASSQAIDMIARYTGYNGHNYTDQRAAMANWYASRMGIHLDPDPIANGKKILLMSKNPGNLEKSLNQSQQEQKQGQQGNVAPPRSGTQAQGGQGSGAGSGGGGGFWSGVIGGIANGMANIPLFSGLRGLVQDLAGGANAGTDTTSTDTTGSGGAGSPPSAGAATPLTGGSTPQNQAYVTDQNGNQVAAGAAAGGAAGGISQQAWRMAGVDDPSKATSSQLARAQNFEKILQGSAKPPDASTGPRTAKEAFEGTPARPMGTTSSPSFLSTIASHIPVIGPLLGPLGSLTQLLGNTQSPSTPASAAGKIPTAAEVAQAGKGAQQAPIAHVEITASKKLERLFHFRNMADKNTAGGEVSKGNSNVRQDSGGKIFGGPIQ